jgi:hypothetical protein
MRQGRRNDTDRLVGLLLHKVQGALSLLARLGLKLLPRFLCQPVCKVVSFREEPLESSELAEIGVRFHLLHFFDCVTLPPPGGGYPHRSTVRTGLGSPIPVVSLHLVDDILAIVIQNRTESAPIHSVHGCQKLSGLRSLEVVWWY